MGNKNKQNAQPSAGNEQAEQAGNTMNVTEAGLLNKQQELKKTENSLSQKETAIAQKEQELNNKQQKLNAREKLLNEEQAKFEQNQSDLTNRDAIVKEKSEELAKKDLDILSREKEITQRELNAKNNFVKEQREALKQGIEVQLKELDSREQGLKTLEARLQDRENEIASQNQEQEKKAEALRKREVAITTAEQKRDEGFTVERKQLDDDLAARRSAVENYLSEKRTKELNSHQERLSNEATKQREAFNTGLSVERSQFEDSLKKEKSDLKSKNETLVSRSAKLNELKDELEFQKQRLQSSKDRLEEREANLNLEVDNKVVERKQSFESEKDALKDEIARLRESITTSSTLISIFEELKRKLGDEDPAAVLLKLQTYEEEIKNLRDDLATRPTQEMQEAFDRFKGEQTSLEQACNTLSDENVRLKKNAQEQSQLELKISELETEKESYKKQFESVGFDNNRLMEDLKRLQSSYEREQDREARIRDIETPYVKKKLTRDDALEKEKQVTELQWLDGISESCKGYGLRFPRRILHAFHTALKTSEWSPITVLAGVSGTGKSELPRLYSHFGGINFMSLSVQPNWDSQESMLGFFNSIDNKFDAQPVLRLLAQTQKTLQEDYPYGLEDVMSLILMDEMNLAHVELYFAEFLSKLELRRGMKEDLPFLDIKLGAGIQPYQLPIGRNVLWAGTMNQDETTKSLSDKVLDRGIVINFPRPTTLERRRQLKPLGDQAPLLSRKLWESWWCREVKFNDDQILPFKGFIEEMNDSLSNVGRALGHRVWQSIEYYMSNYPDVLEAQRENDDTGLKKAMKVAFEDQLVQKVMPKLRGIETRGKSKSNCLDKIRTQLVNDDYTIIEDFDLACEFGYGQFIWNSANYLLKDDEPVNGQGNAEN